MRQSDQSKLATVAENEDPADAANFCWGDDVDQSPVF